VIVDISCTRSRAAAHEEEGPTTVYRTQCDVVVQNASHECDKIADFPRVQKSSYCTCCQDPKKDPQLLLLFDQEPCKK
jgi:hypothetical protein